MTIVSSGKITAFTVWKIYLRRYQAKAFAIKATQCGQGSCADQPAGSSDGTTERRKRSDSIDVFQIGLLKLDIKFAVTDEAGMEGDVNISGYKNFVSGLRT